ncbi:MAG TPA: hypothetical protein VFQ44_29620 [Streptosporangiaceae bacterium]|nr:hypothetical protein [Streptosporangiaceae bacterium]
MPSADSAVDVEFCLLGPLRVRRGAFTIRLSSGKQRAVLATLLLAGNAVVSQDDLMEALRGSRAVRARLRTDATPGQRCGFDAWSGAALQPRFAGS